MRREPEPHGAEVVVCRLEAFAHQQRAHLEACGAAGGERAPEVAEGETRVDDVLDDQDVPSREVDVEVLHYAHDARGAGGVAVGRHRHEVDLEGQRDAAGQVRSEEHTSELQSLMRISYAVFCLKKKKTKEQT